ncbi:MAG: DNA sulfur modification protein DndD, partial [Thermoclostridium sp.]|nr:DNA sulfur modification protein DndD [Thermoclostridium sp.]
IGGMNGAGKTSIMEAINYCLYGAKLDEIFRNINRREKAKGNAQVSFELIMEMDDASELVVKRSWSGGAAIDPKARDLVERLVIVKDGKRVSVQNQEIWQDFIRATIPPGITQFFFFDGEKIQEIAADDHSEVRLKSSLEAALGIQYITKLASDVLYIKQEERKGFIEISDEDLEFKQSELKREKSKLNKKSQERGSVSKELEELRSQLEEAKKRFEAAFHAAPDSREILREQEKRRIQTSNRLGQVESEIRNLCEKMLPFGITGKLFEGIRKQIESERESSTSEAIKEHATTLAKRIVRVVEEPEPIYHEKLSPEKMDELERRIYRLLKEGDPKTDITKILDLSDRDAARVLNKLDALETSDIFLIPPLLEEKRELEAQIKHLEGLSQVGLLSESERELFEQLQSEMEGCSTQIGRKSEQLRLLEEEILSLEKCIREIEVEIQKLYEKHNISKERADFIQECDTIANVLNQFIVRLRKNKVHLLQEKTFEMYRLLSSRSGLIKDIIIDNKTYEVRITDRNGHEIKKSALSAGEKEIFAVSLLWGLAQTSQLKLPIIIDTPLSRLDSAHRDNIVNNYFPNAGEQVIILSTDTEIDNNYYRTLKPHLSGAASLEFDQRQELTTFKEGYFWEK